LKTIRPLALLVPLILGCRGGRYADCTRAEVAAARKLWTEYCDHSQADRREARDRACAAFEKTGPAGVAVITEVLATPGAACREPAACILQSFMWDDPAARRRGQELIWPYLADKDPRVASVAALVLARFADDSLPDRAVELLRADIPRGPNPGCVFTPWLEALARLPYKRVRHIFLEQLKARRDEPFRNMPSPGACEIWDLPLAFVVKYLGRQNDPAARKALLELARHRFSHPPKDEEARQIQLYYLTEALGQLRDERSVLILIEQLTGDRFVDPAQKELERLTGRTDLRGAKQWRQWAGKNRGQLLKPATAKRP
jgi:hypothetical protein